MVASLLILILLGLTVFFGLDNLLKSLMFFVISHISNLMLFVHVSNFRGLSGSDDRGGGDNSIQFINFGRVSDKSFEKWRQKIGEWKGG